MEIGFKSMRRYRGTGARSASHSNPKMIRWRMPKRTGKDSHVRLPAKSDSWMSIRASTFSNRGERDEGEGQVLETSEGLPIWGVHVGEIGGFV